MVLLYWFPTFWVRGSLMSCVIWCLVMASQLFDFLRERPVPLYYELWSTEPGCFVYSCRSVWTATTSAACSTPRGAGAVEGGPPRPRAASMQVATARLVITIRDPSETEGWRRTNRTALRWWTECRRRAAGRTSHLETRTRKHNRIRKTHRGDSS